VFYSQAKDFSFASHLGKVGEGEEDEGWRTFIKWEGHKRSCDSKLRYQATQAKDLTKA